MGNLILTDCFGVILNEVAVSWFNDHFSNRAEAAALKEKYFHEVDMGNISSNAVFDKLEEDLGYDGQKLKKDWYRRIHLRMEVLDYLISLRKKGNKLALLSNAGSPFIDEIIEKYGLASCFDAIFVSCHHHLVKPDPAFYELAVSSFKDKFEHIYMIDDMERNLTPLPALGITGILFTDLDSLKNEIQ